ncbi:transglutaminase family protein [Sphingomonas koreensis]|nr:transglutaminase family protein [Sphingomonas koreensis]
MKLSIDHVTRYRFSQPQARLVQLLRLSPHDSDQQTVTHWRIDMDCDARLRDGRDGFGNATTMLYAEGPIDAIEIAVSGEALTGGAPGVVSGIDEPLPPALFLRSTPLTRADAALTDFAAAYAGPGAIERMAAALQQRFVVDPGRPTPGRTAADAFANDTATSRDMAQMLIAMARSTGLPARYVSGYSSIAPGGGHASPHGWVEAFVEEWIAVDPCAGGLIDDYYVRIAAALDSAGVPPVAGFRAGSGKEELAVDLSVAPIGGDE